MEMKSLREAHRHPSFFVWEFIMIGLEKISGGHSSLSLKEIIQLAAGGGGW